MDNHSNISELVTIEQDQPVTSSLVIAEGTGVAHKCVLETIRLNLTDLGPVTFVQRPGGNNSDYALLNERQAMVMIPWTENSEAFKIRLSKRFYKIAAFIEAIKPQPLTLAYANKLYYSSKLALEESEIDEQDPEIFWNY